ncbi:MAG: four helix bundle protein [Melioribacteraceae bacterium]
MIEKFEDLNVWKESMRLSVNVYKALKNCKDFGLRDQMQRASVSVPSNISEGFERESNKEYIRFLFIAKASCGELRTQIYLSIDLNILNEKEGKELLEQSRKVSAMLYKLIKTRKEKF